MAVAEIAYYIYVRPGSVINLYRVVLISSAPGCKKLYFLETHSRQVFEMSSDPSKVELLDTLAVPLRSDTVDVPDFRVGICFLLYLVTPASRMFQL